MSTSIEFTTARQSYAREQARVNALLVFILNGAVALLTAAVSAFDGASSPEEALDRLREHLNYKGEANVDPSEIMYGHHRPLVAEMLLCRLVENFLTYIVDLLAMIYLERPEMLRSGEQVSVDFVLQHEDISALRRSIAERRVERLSYLGMRDLAKHVADQHGFDLIPDGEDLTRAVLLIEMRNLIVHNRGIVSRTSVAKAPDLAAYQGQRLPLEYADVRDHRSFLDEQVRDIDERAAAKFGLARNAGLNLEDQQ